VRVDAISGKLPTSDPQSVPVCFRPRDANIAEDLSGTRDGGGPGDGSGPQAVARPLPSTLGAVFLPEFLVVYRAPFHRHARRTGSVLSARQCDQSTDRASIG